MRQPQFYEGNRETVFGPNDFSVRVGWYQGESRCPPAPYYHAEVEFLLICQGEGEYFIRDLVYNYQRHSVLFIHRNEVHNNLAHPESNIARMNLLFSQSISRERPLIGAILDTLADCHHLRLCEKAATIVKLLLSDIHEECRLQRPYWREAVLNGVEQFLIHLLRARQGETAPAERDSPLITEVIAYLEGRYADHVTLGDVAAHFHLSPYSLSREFKKFAGFGFKQYLIHRRVVRAKSLLEETDLKVAAVAAEVGFDDLSSFNRAFKQLVGVTPSDYRKISS